MTGFSQRFKTLATNAVHAGSPQPKIEGAVVTPVFQSANYLMRDETAYDGVRYIRLSNSPNHLTLQARLAALEGAEAALLTSSGMAAISVTVLSLVKAGDHLMAQRTLYGGTQTFLDQDAPNLGFGYSSFDATADPSTWEPVVRENTRAIYVESISNPLIEVGDLRAVVAFATKHGLVSVIDNTFATPINFRPLEIGFDIVVHSATKYLNGHSDIVAGVALGSAERIAEIRRRSLHLGGALDPHACFLLERGLKTLPLRIRQQNESALELARFLDRHPAVRQVCYPGLPADPGHERASASFSGYGGMLSFYTDTVERANSLIAKVRIPLHAASLGGVETLIGKPASHSHLGLSDRQRRALKITDDLIRISVGIEDIDELIEDFAQALS